MRICHLHLCVFQPILWRLQVFKEYGVKGRVPVKSMAPAEVVRRAQRAFDKITNAKNHTEPVRFDILHDGYRLGFIRHFTGGREIRSYAMQHVVVHGPLFQTVVRGGVSPDVAIQNEFRFPAARHQHLGGKHTDVWQEKAFEENDNEK